MAFSLCKSPKKLFAMHDHDLNLHGQTLKMLISRKWYKLAQKYVMSLFFDSDICHGNGTRPIVDVAGITLTLIFNAKLFLVMHLR